MQRTHRSILLAMMLGLLAMLGPGRWAQGATYTVATKGDDANPGTRSSPFRTLAKGVSVLKPGDTLLVRAGTYVGSSQLRNISSGTSWHKPVTIKAHPGERPVIVAEPKETVIYFAGNQYIVIDGMVIDGKGGHDGIKITYFTGGTQAHHIRIQNSEIKNATNQGLLVAGEGNEFINLDVHDNGTTDLTHGIYLSADRNLIDGGKYYRNAGWGIHIYPKATNTIVRNVRSFDNGATGLGLVWGSNNQAYNNLVYRNGSGIHLSGDSPRCYNNTVYNNRGEGLSIANADNGPNGTRKADVRNNIVYQNGSAITDYATGTGTVLSNNLTTGPRFINTATGDFRLQKGSPAIDAGVDLRSQGVTTDFEGNPRPQGKAFDIGADEFMRTANRAPVRAESRQRPASTPRAKGPLRIHPRNPRYFTDGTGRVVYLTGSHNWYNLQDAGQIGGPLTKKFDYEQYLELLERANHNFMRMWAWEGAGFWWLVKVNDQVKVNDEYYEPLPYRRTGPGMASDGKPKFDLNQFDPGYFKRLRSRVVAARDRGIYVSVMLFQGWSLYSHGYGNPWPLHPFNAANNVNGINGDADKDGEGKEVHSLGVPAVTRLQEAYIRKVIDTVNDLNNVLYEVTNETAIHSKDWQSHIVRYVKDYESKQPKQHPVGMTYFDSGPRGSMDALFQSPADWISPGDDGGQYDYRNDPPAADGRKVIISDTDHIFGVGGDLVWVWKSFTRGHHPIYMDPLRHTDGLGVSEAQMDGSRKAMGHTRRFAERMNLAAMTPAQDLASTKYCLADPGKEYLVYLPEGGQVTVDLSAARGDMAVEWFDPETGKTAAGHKVSGGARREFKAPFEGDAVLYLVRADRKQSAAAGPPVRVLESVVIYEDPRFYAAFPSIVRRADGELLVAFRRAPERRRFGEPTVSHTDPNSYLVLVRSRDGGRTWSREPELIHAHPFGGSQDPCMVQLGDGTILCSSYAWALLEAEAIPKLKQPVARAGSFVFLGGYLMRSRDGGRSWQGPLVPPPCRDEAHHDIFGSLLPAANRGAMCEGGDGRLYWVVASSNKSSPQRTATHLLVSEDKGETWKYSSVVAQDARADFNEASLYQTPKGDLVTFLRTEHLEDHTYIARSSDGGKSFQWHDAGFQGHPHHALRLPDGRVLLVYGYRHPPFGIRARVLNPECTDATTAPEIVLRDDGGNGDLGYPWATMVSDGRALVIYYFNRSDGTRHIVGTYLQIK